MGYYDNHLPGDPCTHDCVHDYEDDPEPAPINKIARAASYGRAFRGSLEGHVVPSMANWDMNSEDDLLTFGDRVARALDMERLGYSALDDLQYEAFMAMEGN